MSNVLLRLSCDLERSVMVALVGCDPFGARRTLLFTEYGEHMTRAPAL
jgi:hypothetical protein